MRMQRNGAKAKTCGRITMWEQIGDGSCIPSSFDSRLRCRFTHLFTLVETGLWGEEWVYTVRVHGGHVGGLQGCMGVHEGPQGYEYARCSRLFLSSAKQEGRKGSEPPH